MFDTLFGGEVPLFVKFILAFVIVLALIVAVTWLIRRFGTARLGAASARGRQPRLAVIDAAAVDSRRRLVLIRRDNVEHLVLIGGPSDIVVEQNIVRAVPVAPPREAPPVRAHGGDVMARPPDVTPRQEPPARPMPPEPAWQPEPAAREPIAREPVTREPVREPITREPVREPGAREPITREPVAREGAARTVRPAEPTFAPPVEPSPRREAAPKVQPPVDLPPRPLPEPVTAALRAASTPEAPRAPSPPKPAARPAEPEAPVEVRQSPPTADVNLADMAQRLEAALRRPARSGEPREAPPRPELKPRPPEAARPATPPREAAPPQPPAAPAAEATPEPPQAVAPEGAATPEPAPPAEPAAEAKPAPAKSVFDSLEEEMANLLGRPSGKSSSQP
jgi:hypothetical protein